MKNLSHGKYGFLVFSFYSLMLVNSQTHSSIKVEIFFVGDGRYQAPLGV